MINSFPLVITGILKKIYQFGYKTKDYIKKYTRFGILLKKKYNFVPVKV